MKTLKQTTWLFALLSGLLTSASALAATKVVVVPIPADVSTLKPFAPVTADSPPGSAYTINTDTVIDKITGLEWERDIGHSHSSRTLFDALDDCNALTLAGKTDWRLPKLNELLSIVNYGSIDPAINSSAFLNAQSYGYLTINPVAHSSHLGDYWIVNFYAGHADGADVRGPDYWTRCVRGGDTHHALLLDNGNGTVTDKANGLIWQQQDSSVDSWASASNYCATLSLGGKTDWRVPTVKELASLVNYQEYNPALNETRFPGASSGTYWSASDYANDSNSAWSINFANGQITISGKTYNYLFVRCVR